MSLLARARELEAAGHDIIHLEVGEPDFLTPESLRLAARTALKEDGLRYTPAQGVPELRQAIARFYARREGVALDWRRVVVTPGASGGLLLALAATLDPGDGLLMGDPGYPSNRHLATILSLVSEPLPLDPEHGFQPTPEQVMHHWGSRSRALLLTTPANPTGAVVERERMERLVETVRRLGGHLLVDEIYRGLIYETPPPSVLQVDEQAWVVNSFSKYFGMTGWRLGWVVAPDWALDVVENLAQNLYLAPSTLAQRAALAALEEETLEELDRRRDILRARRDYLLTALRSVGFRIPVPPRGAFYLYADCSPFGEDAETLAQRFLEEGAVAVTPGVDFGSHHSRTYLRFTFTTERERLEEAVERIRRLV